MERLVVDEAALRARLAGFENEYGLTSVAFLRLHKVNDDPPHIPPFERLVWADTCLRWHRALTRDQPSHTSTELVPAS
jgi:hypothetical protein